MHGFVLVRYILISYHKLIFNNRPCLKIIPKEFTLPHSSEVEITTKKAKPNKKRKAIEEKNKSPKTPTKRIRISHISKDSAPKTAHTKEIQKIEKSKFVPAPSQKESEITPQKLPETLLQKTSTIKKSVSVHENLKQISKPKSTPLPKPKIEDESSKEIPKFKTSPCPVSQTVAKNLPSQNQIKQKFIQSLDDEIIPLGKPRNSQSTERSASFKLTPEALKAINARKVSVPKKPLPPLPKIKEDPALRKRLAPLKPSSKIETKPLLDITLDENKGIGMTDDISV